MIGEQFRTNCISSDQTIQSGFFTINGHLIVTNKTVQIERHVMSLLIYSMSSQFNGSQLACQVTLTGLSQNFTSPSVILLSYDTDNGEWYFSHMKVVQQN